MLYLAVSTGEIFAILRIYKGNNVRIVEKSKGYSTINLAR